MFGNIKNIHFIGIGGIGMSGIAHVLLNLGYKVSGSDISKTNITQKLEEQGAAIYHQHQENNIKDSHVIVVSSAIPKDNPEIKLAQRQNIPIIHRSEMLTELMRLKYAVLVAGTHGKTTTTSMIANLLNHAKFDPTVVIGGQFNNINSTAKLGKGDFFVCEADESDGTFLKFSPTIAVVTNIDKDHLDHYKDFDHLKQTFLDFINKIPFYGSAIVNLDNEGIQAVIPFIKKRIISIGTSKSATYRYKIENEKEGNIEFSLWEKEISQGKFILNLPGGYNVANCVAAIATARFLSVDFDTIKQALGNYKGIVHRFTHIGTAKNIYFVDDYAHNPTKIKNVLRAAKNGWNRRIVAIFQPHRYSRVEYCFEEFVRAFYDADVLYITPIYAAGETPKEDSFSKLVSAIRAHGHKDVRPVESFDVIEPLVLKEIKENDLVITLGAGDIWKVGKSLYSHLNLI